MILKEAWCKFSLLKVELLILFPKRCCLLGGGGCIVKNWALYVALSKRKWQLKLKIVHETHWLLLVELSLLHEGQLMYLTHYSYFTCSDITGRDERLCWPGRAAGQTPAVATRHTAGGEGCRTEGEVQRVQCRTQPLSQGQYASTRC